MLFNYVPHVTPHPPIRLVDADIQCHPFIIMHIVTSLVLFWHCKVHIIITPVHVVLL